MTLTPSAQEAVKPVENARFSVCKSWDLEEGVITDLPAVSLARLCETAAQFNDQTHFGQRSGMCFGCVLDTREVEEAEERSF